MLSLEYSEAITEVLDILDHTKKEDIDKIPSKFMDFLKANASKNYKPELDHTKKIKDMQLKRKTKVILAIIYKKFWCNYEQQEKFNKILKENDLKREKEIREKYNPDNLFKERVQKIEDSDNSISMIKYKDSFLVNFIRKIKNIFKIK